MAQISKFSRLAAGAQAQVDLSTNTLVVGSVQIGGFSGTDLTKTIIDGLIALQANLASVTPGSAGSTFVADNNSYSNFTPSAATVKGALQGIDSALATVGLTNYDDSVFYIFNHTDNTKHVKVSAANVATATTRTLTMSNFDTDLAALVNANISASAAIALTKLAALGSTNRALASDASGFIVESAVTSTELGYLSGVTSGIQSQINNITSSIQNFEWQPSVISAGLLTPPGSPATGDRYLINGVGTGAWATHDNSIAQWTGSAWAYTVPTTGTFVAADDQPNQLYLFGGSTWSSKYFESTTASTGLTKVGFDIQLADATGTAVTVTGGALAVLFDNVTIGLSSNQLFVKNGGIGTTQLAATSVTAAKLGSDVAGSGLTGGNGSAIALNPDGTSLEVSGGQARIKSTAYDQKTITGGSGSAAAVQSAPLVKQTMVAGEAFAANTSFVVRFALTGETAGRVYKADKDATSSNKYVAIGFVMSTSSVSTGGNIDVIMLGTSALGSSDSSFASGDVGKEIFVGTAGAFVLGSALANTTNEAQYCIGVVQSTTSIWVDFKQLRGIY